MQINKDYLDDDYIFKLADVLFESSSALYRHLFNSYDRMIEELIPNFLENEEHTITYKFLKNTLETDLLVFENTKLSSVCDLKGSLIYPNDCRIYKKTYSINFHADLKQVHKSSNINTGDVTKTEIASSKNMFLFKLPLMVKSKNCLLNINKDEPRDCFYDPGGYFIVNGNEKVVVCQDKMIENKTLVLKKKESAMEVLVAQVISKAFGTSNASQRVVIKLNKDKILTIKLAMLNEVNLCIVMKAIGLNTDKDIISSICYTDKDLEMVEIVRFSLNACKNDEGESIITKEDALDYLVSKIRLIKNYKYNYGEFDKQTKLKQLKIHLLRDLSNSLPHMKNGGITVAYYFGYMAFRLLNVVLGRDEPNNRDCYTSKRVGCPGEMLYEMFFQGYKKIINELKKILDTKSKGTIPSNIIPNFKGTTIENTMRTSLSTGFIIKKAGVAQVLQRPSYLQIVSLLRRVDSNGGDNGKKLVYPRYFHPSATGFLCPAQTPEHANVGLTKFLTLISSITVMSKEQHEFIESFVAKNTIPIEIIDFNDFYNNKLFKVFLNGMFMSGCDNPKLFENKCNELKLSGKIDQKNVSFVFNYIAGEIRIYTDSGRFVRPVFKTKDNKLIIKKEEIDDIHNTKSKENIPKLLMMLSKYPNSVEYIDSELMPYITIADNLETLDHNRTKMIISSILSEGDFNSAKSKLLKNNYIYDLKKEEILESYAEKEKCPDNRYGNMQFNRYYCVEIHPSMLLALSVAIVPFCDRNQGPRITFSFSQTKQAISCHSTIHRERFDTTYFLTNPQRPLITTRTSKYTNTDILTSGENVIIAVATYTGFNQEDSLIFNKTSLDKGKFAGFYYKKSFATTQKGGSSTDRDDIFTKPDPEMVFNIKKDSCNKINEEGYPELETTIEYGDVILGKIVPVISDKFSKYTKKYKNSSEIYKSSIPSVVDRTLIDITTQEGYKIREVYLRSRRVPKVGDKYSSRHGQKGTIGICLNAEDMPFTENGIIPDIILNPNALPSRMTIGHVFESLSGKLSALKVTNIDGTPFNNYDINNVCNDLEELGYDRYGCETMYNGITGEKLETEISIGCMYYLRLKHMVDDKIHSRSKGPKTPLVRQAPEGRSREGGFRIGEMERDALISSGAAMFLKERFLEDSDKYSFRVCSKCGLTAERFVEPSTTPKKSVHDRYKCRKCGTFDTKEIEVPYAFKLFLQELLTMRILSQIIPENID